MKKKVCVVTGSRAEYGLLCPLLEKMSRSDKMCLQLVVTGSHLEQIFGNTQEEIALSGIPIYKKIPVPLKGDGKVDMANSVGYLIQKFAEFFAEDNPDLLVVLGDRYEIYAACISAALLGIEIAHIHGGEVTAGAVDEFLRHSITKMSFLHFTACEAYRRRVIQMGENPERVYNVGALGVENVINLPRLSIEELSQELQFDLTKEYSVVTFHPETLEKAKAGDQLRELITAMDSFPKMRYVITKANADAGGREINSIWEEEGEKHSNWKIVDSLGTKRYLSVVNYAKMILGNSSSGILEAPALHIPTVNVGERQKGRMLADSIICCNISANDISEAMEKALSKEFSEIVEKTVCPFGDGDTSNKILLYIEEHLDKGVQNIKKTFYDVL